MIRALVCVTILAMFGSAPAYCAEAAADTASREVYYGPIESTDPIVITIESTDSTLEMALSTDSVLYRLTSSDSSITEHRLPYWKVASDEEVDAALAPLSPEEEKLATDLRRPPSQQAVPVEKNAAPIYRQMFALMDADAKYMEEIWEAAGSLDPAKEYGIAEPIPLEEGGTTKPRGYQIIYQVVGKDLNFDLDYSQGLFMPTPHLMKVRKITRIMMVQAAFDYKAGRETRALDDVRVIFAMSRQISAEPIVISQLVSIAIEALGDHILMDLAMIPDAMPGFRKGAVELLESLPARRLTTEQAMEGDFRLAASYLLNRLYANDMTPGGFADEIIGLVRAALPESERPATIKSKTATKVNLMTLEMFSGLPQGSIIKANYRTFFTRWVLFYWRQAGIGMAALQHGSKATVEFSRQLNANRDAIWKNDPQSFLTRSMLPAMWHYPIQSAKADVRRKAAMEVIKALLRGDRRVPKMDDIFGEPYKVTWFDDGVYFESLSETDRPGIMDIWFGIDFGREEYLKRTGRESELQAQNAPSTESAIR